MAGARTSSNFLLHEHGMHGGSCLHLGSTVWDSQACLVARNKGQNSDGVLATACNGYNPMLNYQRCAALCQGSHTLPPLPSHHTRHTHTRARVIPLQKLQEAEDEAYGSAAWANGKSLKAHFAGMQNVRIPR